jgi:hypothetical protein
LHGSLNWRERIVDGKTVRVSTEELINGSRRYRKNYLIYPAEKFKPEIDPFRKLHDFFVDEYLACDTAIFLGFKFRDDYINSVINQASNKKQVIVITPHASEFVQNNKLGTIEYKEIARMGKDNNPEFKMELLLDGKSIASGRGGSKRAANAEAAKKAMAAYRKR